MRRFYLLLASISVMAILLAVVPLGTAFASGGPGHYVGPNKYKGNLVPNTTCAVAPSEQNCTGKDPIAEGCQPDAYNVDVAYIYNGNQVIGEADLRYSHACQSNWARTLFYSSQNDYISATVIRQTDGKTYEYHVIGTSVYTNMVYAPGTVEAKACGGIEGTWSSCTPFI